MSVDNFQDFQESLDTLLDLANSQPEILTRMRNEQQIYFDRHLKTRELVTQTLKECIQLEEGVAQWLIDMEEKRQQENEMESLDEQLRSCMVKSQTLDSELQYLQQELERLRSPDNELTTLQCEVEEDTTEVIPSSLYVVKMYYLITKIKWEYDTEPHILKGVHYGKDVATPINMDTTVNSQDIAEKLWSFV